MAENIAKWVFKSVGGWIKYSRDSGLIIEFGAKDYALLFISISTPMLLDFAKWVITKIWS